MYLDIIFKVFGGLGIFLYGMTHMSNGMQKMAGDRLKKILSLLTGNRIAAVLVGVLVTGLVQSSSVSTVMTIGFVNASLLSLRQAVGVILGANIGTTITGWILVLKIGKYGLPMAGLAAIVYLFSSSEKAKTRALTVMGLGFIFLGLEIMADGLKPVKDMPEFIRAFHAFDVVSMENGVKSIHFPSVMKAAMVGTLMTAIVQSSSATLGITIALALQGLLNYETAVALVLGENVGTTITALLASLNASANAKRAALAHTMVNLVGVFWVIPIFTFYLKFLHNFVNPETDVTKFIATAHTMFNVVNVILFIPFIGLLAKFLEWIIKDDEVKAVSTKTTHLDPLLTDTPAVVIGQTKEEILAMGGYIQTAFESLNKIYNDRATLEANMTVIEEIENKLDLYEKEITDVNFVILHKDLAEEEVTETRENLIICDEYETISDYILRIGKSARKLIANDIYLDEKRKATLVHLHTEVLGIFNLVNDAYHTNNKDLFFAALKKANGIKGTYNKAREAHLFEIPTDEQQTLLSTSYMDMLNSYRRIKEHLYGVIETFTKIS